VSVSLEVHRNLRILGLTPGATSADIRAAFRSLARTCHPDVAGRHGERKFEQITGAYTFLKNLTKDELAFGHSEAVAVRQVRWEGRRRQGVGQSQEVSQPRGAGQTQRTTQPRGTGQPQAEQEAAERRGYTRMVRADAALARSERALDGLSERMNRHTRDSDLRDVIMRLSSDVRGVRHLSLAKLGTAANRSEIVDALLNALRKWSIDEKTANLVIALPLSPENRKRLLSSLVDKVPEMPDAMLIYLLNIYGLGLTTPSDADRSLWERCLLNAGPNAAAIIIRHWPKGKEMSAPVLQNLLSCNDEMVLVPLLGILKQRSFVCPPWGRERLTALSSHDNLAVRTWAKALLGKK
jgi:curved DNA-binding protein CbpA